jgi:hypothetical protein
MQPCSLMRRGCLIQRRGSSVDTDARCVMSGVMVVVGKASESLVGCRLVVDVV